MKCLCGKERNGDKLGHGWKADPAGNSVCPDCWAKRYILRAVTFPVAGPVDCEWPELREMLADAWGKATRLANLAVQELLKNDVVRTADAKKLPAMPKTNLYQACSAAGYDGWASSAASLLRAVEGKYRAARYDRIWLGQVSLPNTKYPMPFPIHNATWQASYDDGNRPLVTLRLPARRVTLRLRGGKEFCRQLAAFRQIVSGEAIRGELSIYRQRANGSDHRNGTESRDESGAKMQTRVMVKLVAWLPRPQQQESKGTLFLTTGPDALLIALDAKDNRLWLIHADHIRRWDAEHKAQLQRWHDDAKAEQRPRAAFASRREKSCRKYERRMNTACGQFAAQVVGYANRRRFAEIQWVQPIGGKETFRWSRLFSEILYRADREGIICKGMEPASGNGKAQTE
jgi:hypothetical protein